MPVENISWWAFRPSSFNSPTGGVSGGSDMRAYCLHRSLLLGAVLSILVYCGNARADIFVSTGVSVAPACGGSAEGATSASVSLACTDSEGDLVSGNSTAQVGIGPYGIGASWDLEAQGLYFTQDPLIFYFVGSRATLSWSQEFVLEGATGSGFVEPAFAYSLGIAGCAIGGCTLLMTIDGTIVDPASLAADRRLPTVPSASLQIPITYNEPFTVTVYSGAPWGGMLIR
jgi:hypothetical protein